MKIRRTLPPTAAPLHTVDIIYGFAGLIFGKKYLDKLKKELQEYFNVKHVFLVSSGKAALTIILNALKEIDTRREVIIPAYTCYSVPAAIIKAGLIVKLCDIEINNYDFNYKELEKKINKNTLCVIPNNLFSIPSDVEKIKTLCSNNKSFIIEDAAQAMGGIYKNRPIGTNGDVAFFSLGRGKNITSGSGGIIITNSSEIAYAIQKDYSQLESASNFKEMINLFQLALMAIFIHPWLYWLPSRLTFLKLGETIFPTEYSINRLSGIKAGVLNNWQNNLNESKKYREINVKNFDSYIKPVRPYLRIPFICETVQKRDKLLSISRQKGLGINLMYPSPVNEIEEIKEQFTGEVYQKAKFISERLVTIPTHHFLKENDRVTIKKYLMSF